MDELKETVETLIEMDEPEAMLATIRRAAQRQKGARWQLLARVLAQAEANMDQEQAKPTATAVEPADTAAKAE